MSASRCSDGPDRKDELSRGLERRSLRRILWIALAINAGMFALEVAAGAHARSSSLQADALDFLADAANYVIGLTGYHALTGTVPRAEVMGVVGALALVANVAVLALLVSFRRGDSNMRSVRIRSRNDVVGNMAVLVAASGVIATKTGWPDVIVALGMAALAFCGATQIVPQAVGELRALGHSSHDQTLDSRSHGNLA